ncbi:MAG TPA: hypothetical protein VGK20_05735 [Candidatus Binatia bacterium]|jgi:hypothetical protein
MRVASVFVAVLAALAVAGAHQDARAQDPEPVPSYNPFGPGYDPTRPPPQAPSTRGPGISSASPVVAGPAEVENRPPEAGPALYGVVLDIEVAPSSMTDPLDAKSVTARTKDGQTLVLNAACLPTAQDPLTVSRSGGSIGSWNVSIGGRIFQCGGRNAHMTTELGANGSFRLSTVETKWRGPLVLMFVAGKSPVVSVTVLGRTIHVAAAATGQKKK